MEEVSKSSIVYDLLEKDKDIKLVQDIEIDRGVRTKNNYSGTFDGNGHTIYGVDDQFIEKIEEEGIIKNVTFKDVEIEDEVGIFRRNLGELKNVKIIDSYIHSTIIPPSGILVGVTKGKVKNCSVLNSELVGIGRIGLLCGDVTDTSIINCSVEGRIQGLDFSRSSYVGGISGCSKNSTIKNSTVKNLELYGGSFSAGLCGLAKEDSSIQNCTVNSVSLFSSRIGGLVNEVENSTIKNSNVSLLTGRGKEGGGICNKLMEDNSEILNCSIKNSTIFGINSGANNPILGSIISKFYEEPLVKNTFSQNVKLKSLDKVMLDIESVNLKNVYIDERFDCPQRDITESNMKDRVFTERSDFDTSTAKTMHINKSSDLYDINKNDTVILEDDIYISSDQMIKIELFNGIFDGDGYTISGLKNSLFKQIGNKATIKDLTLEDSNIENESMENSLLCSVNKGTIKNITIKSTDIKLQGTGDLGLISSTNKGNIVDCEVYNTTIKALEYKIGGIVSKNKSEIHNCTVDCQIRGKEKSVGLIAANLDSESLIKDCKSTGYIEGEERIGGIVGKIGSRTSDTETGVSNSSSSAVIRGKEKVGGIIGHSFNYKTTKCTFTGDLKTTQKGGGIIGEAEHTSSIENCLNNGHIKMDKNTGGGIVGLLEESKITDCRNKAKISGNKHVGGIVGLAKSGQLDYTVNSGIIIGKHSVGGLIGTADDSLNTNGKVVSSYNNSNILYEETGNILIGTINDKDDYTFNHLFWIEQENYSYTSEIAHNVQSETILQTILL